MSPNLLVTHQEKIRYGEREHGGGWIKNGDTGAGEEDGDKGTSWHVPNSL